MRHTPVAALLGLALRGMAAALLGLATSLAIAISLRHADRHGGQRGGIRRRIRALSDRLDRAQRDLPVSADDRARLVRDAAPQHHHASPPTAGSSCCSSRSASARSSKARPASARPWRSRRALLIGSGSRRSPHPAVAHREHCAGGVRRAGHADHRAAGRDGARSLRI